MLAATIANVHRDSKVRAKPWSPGDFFDLREILGEATRDEIMTPEEIRTTLQSVLGVAEAMKKSRGK